MKDDILDDLIRAREYSALARDAADEIERLRRALHEIINEWAGRECGVAVTAQEDYVIALAKRMFWIAADALTARPQRHKCQHCGHQHGAPE
jgi:hypothetical protein